MFLRTLCSQYCNSADLIYIPICIRITIEGIVNCVITVTSHILRISAGIFTIMSSVIIVVIITVVVIHVLLFVVQKTVELDIIPRVSLLSTLIVPRLLP